MRQLSLLSANSSLKIMIRLPVVDVISFGINIELMHRHIQTNCGVWINFMGNSFMRHLVKQGKIVFAVRLMCYRDRLRTPSSGTLRCALTLISPLIFGKVRKPVFRFAILKQTFEAPLEAMFVVYES